MKEMITGAHRVEHGRIRVYDSVGNVISMHEQLVQSKGWLYFFVESAQAGIRRKSY